MTLSCGSSKETQYKMRNWIFWINLLSLLHYHFMLLWLLHNYPLVSTYIFLHISCSYSPYSIGPPREILCQTFRCSNNARKCFVLWQSTSLNFTALKAHLSRGLQKLAHIVGITNGLMTGSSKTLWSQSSGAVTCLRWMAELLPPLIKQFVADYYN